MNVRTWVRGRLLWHIVAAAAILVPSLYGFGSKFVQLIRVYQGDADGAFAIAPIVNYLLASAGFLLLFAWAAANGMFRDLERPKTEMLEREAQLDAAERMAKRASLSPPH